MHIIVFIRNGERTYTTEGGGWSFSRGIDASVGRVLR